MLIGRSLFLSLLSLLLSHSWNIYWVLSTEIQVEFPQRNPQSGRQKKKRHLPAGSFWIMESEIDKLSDRASWGIVYKVIKVQGQISDLQVQRLALVNVTRIIWAQGNWLVVNPTKDQTRVPFNNVHSELELINTSGYICWLCILCN